VALISEAFAESQAAGYAALLEALRTYFGSKLGMPSGAITFGDLAARLEASDLDREAFHELRKLFEQCEASTFAGGAGQGTPPQELLTQAKALITQVEGAIK